MLDDENGDEVKPDNAGPEPQGRTRRRSRTTRPFPAASFEEALSFARELFTVGSGRPVRRLTLFDHLGKAPESGASRMLITNANRYGLISGGYTAEQLQLTAEGLKAVDENVPKREQARIRVKLAVENIEPFKQLYDRFKSSRLPARAVLIDALKEFSVPGEFLEECVDTFIVNLRFVGLLQTLSGADRIVTIDHLLDNVLATTPAASQADFLATSQTVAPIRSERRDLITQEDADFQTSCFYITPIGDDGSEQRKHSDLFLGNIVEPALAAFGLRVIRADAIDKPGMITRQVIEYLLRSPFGDCRLIISQPECFL